MKSSSVGFFRLQIIRPVSLLIILLAALSACAEEEPAATGEVAFSLKAAALRLPGAAEAAGDFQAQALTGHLAAIPRDGGQSQIFPWSISIDPDNGEITSHVSIILEAGLYDFSMLVSINAHQYVGTNTAHIEDTYNYINMTLRPIIGDSTINVGLIDQLAVFRFSYPVSELSAVADPRLGVVVDNGGEIIYLIDKATGLSQAYVNLPNGPHQVRLKFYDGSIQIGRSIDVQEWVTIVPGQQLSISLVPFAGETDFVLTRAGGNARFTFTVPSEVVDEAGGLANLTTHVTLSGPENPMRTLEVALAPGTPGTYRATAMPANMHYGNLTVSMSFSDTRSSPPELIGSCAVPVTLRDSSASRPCHMFLRRRAMHSGELISLVGINVLDAASEHVSGAQVFVNGNPYGLTGEGFGSPGYLRRFLNAGQYTISAATLGFAGSVNVNIAPLSIQNVVIRLAPTP